MFHQWACGLHSLAYLEVALCQSIGATYDGHEDDGAHHEDNDHDEDETVHPPDDLEAPLPVRELRETGGAGLGTVRTPAGRQPRPCGLLAGHSGRGVITVPGGRLTSRPSVLVGDLERRVTVADTSHEVKPALGCALLTAPAATQERHHRVRGGRELDILTGLVCGLVELLAYEVSDGLDHLLLLPLVVPLAGPRDALVDPHKVALTRVAGDIAEILTNISL